MATQYLVKLSVTLRPVNNRGALTVRLGIDDNLAVTSVQEVTTIHFEFEAQQTCRLIVELLDKVDQEAVIIEQISFFGINDPKFVWAGIYEPRYPEPWATEQRSQGIELHPKLIQQNYLGWPGKWTLTFDVPVFSWIHRTQNLGWMYS